MVPHAGVKTDRLTEVLREVADLLADAIVEKLKPKLHRPAQQGLSEDASRSLPYPSASSGSNNLWSLKELARDSGLSKTTWYKWVNQRRIPVVRLGRAVRVRDSDYRKLIQQSLSSPVSLKGFGESPLR